MHGHVLPQLGRWDEALERFETADRLHREYAKKESVDPADDWLFFHNFRVLATVHMRMGHDDEAERLLRELGAIKPDGFLGESNPSSLIEYLILKERFDEALAAAGEMEKRSSAMAQMIQVYHAKPRVV